MFITHAVPALTAALGRHALTLFKLHIGCFVPPQRAQARGKGGQAGKHEHEPKLWLGAGHPDLASEHHEPGAHSRCEACGQALAEDKARQAHERELEVARLRAAQEKILDRRSEMDELRARR